MIPTHIDVEGKQYQIEQIREDNKITIRYLSEAGWKGLSAEFTPAAETDLRETHEIEISDELAQILMSELRTEIKRLSSAN